MRCRELVSRVFIVLSAVGGLSGCADDDLTAGGRDSQDESESQAEADSQADGWTSQDGDASDSESSSEADTTTDATGETGEDPGLGCDEIVDCLLGCITNLGLDCLAECGANADPQALDEVGALLACLGGVCVETGNCDFANQFDQADCLGCIGLGLFLPEPPGCEYEAAICAGEEPPGDGDGDGTDGGDGDGTDGGDGDGDAGGDGDGDGDASPLLWSEGLPDSIRAL